MFRFLTFLSIGAYFNLAFAKPSLPFHYTETGNLKAPSIVFVHAFPMNEKMWDAQVEALKKNYRVLTIDIRGFGKSKPTHPYTLEFVVDDIIALLDHLKIEKTVLCGLSMGGFVGLRAAQRNPERFNGIVLANTKSEPDLDSSKMGRYKGIKLIEEKGLSVFVDEFITKSLAQSTVGNQSPVFIKAKEIALRNKISGVEAGLLALTSRTDTTPDLDKIKIPTLILHGELDTVIPMASAKALNEKIPGSKFYVIPKAGHLSNLDKPDEFNAKLLEFLKRLNLEVTANSI
jgi:3-oxoadipate enol-lactonase